MPCETRATAASDSRASRPRRAGVPARWPRCRDILRCVSRGGESSGVLCKGKGGKCLATRAAQRRRTDPPVPDTAIIFNPKARSEKSRELAEVLREVAPEAE